MGTRRWGSSIGQIECDYRVEIYDCKNVYKIGHCVIIYDRRAFILWIIGFDWRPLSCFSFATTTRPWSSVYLLVHLPRLNLF